MAVIIDITVALFWSKVSAPDLHSCWEWKGRKKHFGYGAYKDQAAHRMAYEMCVGPIPAGLCVRHKCDNPSCVNPAHLEVGTIADNNRDAVDRGRHVTPTGTENGNSRFTDEQVREIRESTETGVALAKRLGCAESTISYIRRRLRRERVS